MTKKANPEYFNQAVDQAANPSPSPVQQKQLTVAQKRNESAKKLQILFEKSAPELMKVLPSHITPERIARVTLTACRKNPTLLDCDLHTLIGSVFQASQLGLEVDLLGSAFLVPFGGKVQLIIGYKGYLELLYRSDRILTIQGFTVYTNDLFKIKNGSNGFLDHDQAEEPSGIIKGYYVIVHLKGGASMWHYMTKAQIEAYRDEFSSDYKYKKTKGKERESIWHKNFDSMAKKTVLRQLITWLPISIHEKQFAAIDETITSDIGADPEYIDAEFEIQEESNAPA